MHDNPIQGRDLESASTAAEDLRDQRIVLTQVLVLHPALLTAAELVKELTGGSGDFEPGDRYERAIQDLCGAGLLQRLCGLVLPTRAALHLDALWQG